MTLYDLLCWSGSVGIDFCKFLAASSMGYVCYRLHRMSTKAQRSHLRSFLMQSSFTIVISLAMFILHVFITLFEEEK